MNPVIRSLSLAAALVLSGTAWADKPVFGDTFMIGVGGMNHKAKTTFRSTRDGRPPVELNLNDLDMDDKATTIWAGLTWQFADSWGLSASYAGFDSDGDVFADSGGNFGDLEWEANARLMSDLSLDLYIVDLHWDFLNTGATHVGVGVGLHIADLDASIQAFAEGSIIGGPSGSIDIGTESAGVTAPLPNASLRAGHRFGDSWYLGGTAGYFGLKVNDIKGELVTARASLDWRPGGGAFGAGLGYQYVNMNVKDTGGSTTKKFDVDFYGPIIFVQLGF